MLKNYFQKGAMALAVTAMLLSIHSISSLAAQNADGILKTYKAPEGVELSPKYSVKVRPVGSDDEAWQELSVYTAKVMSTRSEDAAFVFFDSSGSVEVQITCNELGEEGLNNETSVYPKSYGTELEYTGGSDTITLTTEPNQNLVVDPNGDTQHNIHIYAGEIPDLPTDAELKAQSKSVTYVDAAEGDILQSQYDTDVVYVKPGFYTANISVKSNQTWYLEGGAVINGNISLSNSKNAKLIGRGLIYRPVHLAMTLDNSENAYIDGIMAVNYGWGNNGGYLINISNAKNVVVKRVKSIARHKWGDGIDIFSSEDVSIEDCFIRSNDDCIAVYGPRWTGQYWGDTGNVRNLKVRGCVLMPDNARPIHFGTHGDSSSPNGGRVIDNCTFSDIDILTYNKFAVNNDGKDLPMPIHFDACEGNMITNIFFDNIRIQDGRANKLVTMLVKTQGRYGTNTIPGRGIDNVYFKDIYYNNDNPEFTGEIKGYEKSDGVNSIINNITFENLVINGKPALSAEDAHITVGDYAKNIRFTRSGESCYIYNPSIVPEDIWPEYYDYAVSASADISENGSDPKYVLDDDSSTIWYSQLGTEEPLDIYANNGKLEGLTIDLGTQRHINCVRITWDKSGVGYYYRIFISKDGVNWDAGRSDEQAVGAVNPKSGADFKRVKWTWLANQETPIEGRYVKIVPCAGHQLAIDKVEILGDTQP